MIDRQALIDVISTNLGDDLFLIDVTVSRDNTIVVEIDAYERSVTIDDCVALTRDVEAQFDRDVEDYELEVGSAGLTAPFKVKAQYHKNIGNPVEVLTADGRKLKGTLTEADDDAFVVQIAKMVKPEGAKRKVKVLENETLKYNEIKYTKYLIDFK
ncbi:MAG: ribosome assembly cofactor RimP [Muribaculaceae bacterium]